MSRNPPCHQHYKSHHRSICANSGDRLVPPGDVHGIVMGQLPVLTNQMFDHDFFDLGLDSMRIAQIVHGLRAMPGFDWVRSGIIYKNPTINTLAARLWWGNNNEEQYQAQALMLCGAQSAFAKYCNFSPPFFNTLSIHARSLRPVSHSLLPVPLALLGATSSPSS